MRKRIYNEVENHNYQFQDDVETNEVHKATLDEDVMASIIRWILSKEARNLKVRKDHISTIIREHGSKVNLKAVEQEINKELCEVFGLSIFLEGPSIETRCHLAESSQDLLRTILVDNVERKQPVKNPRLEICSIAMQKRPSGSPNAMQLIGGGLGLLILCIVLINDGQAHETLLIETLNSFGILKSRNVASVGFHFDVDEVIRDLVRKEYLAKNVSVSWDGASESICFTLGSRAFRDYPIQNFRKVIKNIFDDDGDVWLQKVEYSFEQIAKRMQVE